MSCKVTFLLIVLSLVSLSQAIGFSGNVTITNDKAAYQYRATVAGSIPFKGGWYFSVGVAASAVAGHIQGEVDALFGAVYASTFAYPSGFLAYYRGSATANVNKDGGQDWIKFNTTGSAGFLGFSYLRLIEKDGAGAAVATRNFKDLIWAFDLESSVIDGKNDYYVLSFTGKNLANDIRLRVKYVSASKVGVISDEGVSAVVTPRTLESFFYVDAWPYANKDTNTLTLVIGVATAAAHVAGTGTLTTNNGADPMYFEVVPTAAVGGKLTDVSISAWKAVDVTATFENADLEAQLKATYVGGFGAKTVDITFPAGALPIVYDPTAGNGDKVQYVPDDAASLIASSLLLLVCLIFSLF